LNVQPGGSIRDPRQKGPGYGQQEDEGGRDRTDLGLDARGQGDPGDHNRELSPRDEANSGPDPPPATHPGTPGREPARRVLGAGTHDGQSHSRQ
jgi:hypothetical protein